MFGESYCNEFLFVNELFSCKTYQHRGFGESSCKRFILGVNFSQGKRPTISTVGKKLHHKISLPLSESYCKQFLFASELLTWKASHRIRPAFGESSNSNGPHFIKAPGRTISRRHTFALLTTFKYMLQKRILYSYILKVDSNFMQLPI